MSPTESRGPLAPKLPPRHPPSALEERVVETLTRRGFLAPASRSGRLGRAWRAAATIAAGIALFAAGAFAERTRSALVPALDPRPRYALLLYGGSDEGGGAAEQARVDEYRRWARGIAARGHYVAGEKLRDDARELTAAGVAGGMPRESEALAGFFIVSAGTPSEAESIARSCPHLRHGGRVIGRPIEPT